MKQLSVALLAIAISPSLARAACEAPVSVGSPQFNEQMKKSNYQVIFTGEVINTPAVGEAGEASAYINGILITKDNVPELLPQKNGGTPVMKMNKAKSVRLDKGRPFMIFVGKENGKYVLRECNHSYPIKSVLFSDIPKDVAAIKAAFPSLGLPPKGEAVLPVKPGLVKSSLPPPGPPPALKVKPKEPMPAPAKLPEKLPPPGTPPPLVTPAGSKIAPKVEPIKK